MRLFYIVAFLLLTIFYACDRYSPEPDPNLEISDPIIHIESTSFSVAREISFSLEEYAELDGERIHPRSYHWFVTDTQSDTVHNEFSYLTPTSFTWFPEIMGMHEVNVEVNYLNESVQASVTVNVEEDWREPYVGTYDCMLVIQSLKSEGDSMFWSIDTSENNQPLIFTKSDFPKDLIVHMPISLANGHYYTVTIQEDQSFQNDRVYFRGRFFALDSVYLGQTSVSDAGGNLWYTGKKIPIK